MCISREGTAHHLTTRGVEDNLARAAHGRVVGGKVSLSRVQWRGDIKHTSLVDVRGREERSVSSCSLHVRSTTRIRKSP